MKFQFCLLAFAFVAIDNVENLPMDQNRNKTRSLVQSTYAKVTKWGASPSIAAVSEGRSNNGQTLFSQRSDVNIINGQNLKKKPEVTYHYSMLKSNRPTALSHIGHHSQYGKEQRPAAVSQIAEKRYNPKPYFDYSPIPPKNKVSLSGDKDTPSLVYGTPFDSFPSFPKPIPPPKTVVDIKPSINLYNSPYDSYNPPAPSVDAKPAPGPLYPPNDMPPPASAPTYLPPSNMYLPTNSMSKPAVMMDKPSSTGMDNMDSYRGPFAPPPSPDDSLDAGAHDDGGDGPSKDHPSDSNSDEGPPIVKTVDAPMEPEQPYYDHPPKGYYNHDHHYHQQNVQQGDDMDMGMMSGPDDMSASPMSDHQNHGMGSAAAVPADDGSSDLSPPPSGSSAANGLGISMPKLPEYMDHDPSANHGGGYHGYQFDHQQYDDHAPVHHVYKEVHTTTTTEATEDERVNKGHYSYYYLGRKLWYVPLYFSVYFILYITALILKSIARHKVNLVHEYPKGKGRNFAEDYGRPDIDEIQRKVSRAVNDGAQKYAM